MTGNIRLSPSHGRLILVEPLEQVRALQVLVVLPRQQVERQRLAHGVLGPVGKLGVALLPAPQPGGQVGLSLLQVAPVIDPAQLLQTVVVGLSRQVVQPLRRKCT